MRYYTSAIHPPSSHLSLYTQTLAIETMIVTRWLLLFVCYSTALDNTDISTSSKDKTSVSTNGIEVYIKEQLAVEIQRFIIANAQLMTDKMKTEKTKVNLEADRVRLLEEKNSLVVKREEFRVEIAAINAARLSNVLVYSHQDPLLKPVQNKLKAKRLSFFDSLKKNF